MKFKHIIGLDIGTNSLGWCLIKEYEDGGIEIIKTGVHIFPIGTIVDDKNNKEKTKNEQRRAYRGASRLRYRFKLRRKNLKTILESLEMYPDYSKYHRAKSHKEAIGQSYELYKLRADALNTENKIPLREIGRIFMLLNKYRGFKSNSKKLQKKDSESGIVEKDCQNLQKLITKSGAETIGEYFFKMHEKAKAWYDEGKWHNSNEPIDERAFNDSGDFILFNSNGIRRHYGRYTLRDMYYHEFDKIWEAQKKNYPKIFTGSKQEYDNILSLQHKERIHYLKEFKKTNYWHIREYCIYYQRPLKSQKKYISNCQFERGHYEITHTTTIENGIERTKEKRTWKKKAKKACHKSNPLFQEFRIWQKLHQVFFSQPKNPTARKGLPQEWIATITKYLMTNYEIYLNETRKAKAENKYWIGKLLQENKLIVNSDDYNFFIDKTDEDVVGDDKNENKIAGNITYASFLESLGETTFNNLKKHVYTREIQINKDEKAIIEENKLFQLWNILNQAKDGLFKEDDWLKSILTEPTKWNFSPEQADRLISKGLIDDYASYSSKVLKLILPYMRKGMNEYDALKATGKEYINDDNTIGGKVQLKSKVVQLTYQELRNPVVERALSKSIRLVNTILDKYKNEIDRDSFEIRIESTRQLRKPKQERENERRKNTEKDKLREQYASFLTKNKDKLGFKRDINKYDSIITKYELWLQMNMNENDEIFINEFKPFSKITKEEDKLKHKLWLECGRMCPYTGAIINLTDCFSSEVEIEHIIPLSRSLDNSFNNKTLTYRKINAEKGNMTPLEYLSKKSETDLKSFKSRIKGKINAFSEGKIENFLAENVKQDFSSNQISNTSYIAKYTKTKMQEVCRTVQFTNGSATAELRNKDWKLSNLMDKIRYEEEYQINIDDYYKEYFSIRKRFIDWYKAKYKTTDFNINWNHLSDNEQVIQFVEETKNDLLYWDMGIQQFEEFRNKSGKKDRSDHRHHAIDAFVTACCSPKIVKELSTFNAIREKQHYEQRETIKRTFDYNKLKESIANILVSHSEKQSLIKKRKNRIKTKDGIREDITYAPQGKLHEESFYGKRNNKTVRRVKLFDPQAQEKISFNDPNSLDYRINGEVKWHYIDDKELYSIIKNRLGKLGKNAFTKEEMERMPFYRTSPNTPDVSISKKSKPLPIVKTVRKVFNADRTLINLPAKDENGNITNVNRYVDNESNVLLVIYEKENIDKNGKHKRPLQDFSIISFFDYVQKKRKQEKLFADEKNGIGLKSNLNWINKGSFIAIYETDDEKRNYTENPSLIQPDKIFKIKGLSSDSRLIKGKEYAYGYATVIHHSNTNNEEKISHTKFNFIKIDISILGEIEIKEDGHIFL